MTPRQAPVRIQREFPDDLGGLGQLTCPVRGWCLATGTWDYDYAADSPAELQTLSGGVWTAVRAPLPAGTDPLKSEYVGLPGASCVAAGACIAVGTITALTRPMFR